MTDVRAFIEPGATRPAPLHADDDRFVPLAADIGAVVAVTAAVHDRDNTFVEDGYRAMRDAGYLRLAVPEDLGGLGATMRQVTYAQHEVARHCGATALASSMHLYNTLVQVFRRRSGAADAEKVLRRVADEGVVIMTSGGSDWLWPTTTAVPVDGGWRVSGRKRFCSQAPIGDVITTSAVVGEPGDGAEVLMFGLSTVAEGVALDPTWDTMGMRGTSSHDLVLDDVFVPDATVTARREWGRFNPALIAAGIHFAPVIAGVYHGIASAARDEAVRLASRGVRGATPLAEVPRVQRLVGLMDARLRTSWWSLSAALDELGETYGADADALVTVMLAKREVVLAAQEVVDTAMEVAGGASFYRSSPLERAYRDVRAGGFHPFSPDTTLFYAGRVALGGDASTE